MTKILLVVITVLYPCLSNGQDKQLIFGQEVTHPFQWMEDITSDTVKQWLELQKSKQEEYFKKADFKKLNSVLYVPRREHQLKTNRYRFELITTAAAPPKLVVKEFIDGENVVRTLIRCKDFKLNENDFPSIEYYRVTDSDYFLVAAISHSGSDWLELLVYDLENRVLVETLKGIVDPRIFFHYNGFYYERYDEPTDIKSPRTHQRISFHEIGTPQENDQDIFVNADPTSIRYFQFQRIPDSKFIYVFHPTMINGVWKEAITKIELGKFSARQPFFIYSSPHRITFDLIMQEQDTVMMRTDLRNSHFEVIKINTEKVNEYTSFIPPSDLVLGEMSCLSDKYFGLKYLSNGRYMGVIVNASGQVKKRIQTHEGSSVTFQKYSDEKAYCYHQHYLSNYNLEVINLNDWTSKYQKRTYRRGFLINHNLLVTTYLNRDGQDVPITIIFNKDKFDRHGDQPAMIKVYGGYGLTSEPAFNWENYLFVKNGGVLAFPGVRGSGAKGAAWGLAGRGLNKQNTIDDVIAAAEYLILQGFVKKEQLFLQGGSHGGFVAASAAIQRPDLFRGIIVTAGVFDLVTSSQQAVGYAQLNREEYGDPLDSLGFLNRLKLSPMHNLKQGVKYPSFLILTGSNDTRVPPSQSYRFMAALKERSANTVNFLHVTNGGHNIAQFPKEGIEITSLKFKFLWLHTGYKFWKN